MNRPSFSRRTVAHSVPAASGGPEAPGEMPPDTSIREASVALPEQLQADEAVAEADELAAAFLARTSGLRIAPRLERVSAPEEPLASLPKVNEGVSQPQLAVEKGEPVERPSFGSRPPRFGGARRASSAPAVSSEAPAAHFPAEPQSPSGGDSMELGAEASNALSREEAPEALRRNSIGAGPFPAREVGELSSVARDIQAASVVTKLVSGISVMPGSDADVEEKSKVLVALMVLARRSAEDLVGMVDPENADTAWVQAQALGNVADMIAAEWIGGNCDVDEVRRVIDARMELVRTILVDHGGEMEGVLGAVSDGGHERPCSDAQSISDHRAVAIHQSAWAFGAAIAAVRDARGEPFTYGMAQEDVVAALLHQVVGIASSNRPDFRDANASIAYLRGALQRSTQLAIAEYGGKAREACAWVDEAVEEAQRVERLRACPAMFVDKAMPQIAQWVSKNFQSIERASRKLIEDHQNENESADRPGR